MAKTKAGLFDMKGHYCHMCGSGAFSVVRAYERPQDKIYCSHCGYGTDRYAEINPKEETKNDTKSNNQT